MRSLKPLCLTAAVALALAGTNALAATTTTGISAAGASTSATTGTTTSGTTTGTTAGQASTSGTTAFVGGCTGTNGSTCTATTSAQSNPTTANSTTTGVVTQQNVPPGTQGNPSGTATGTSSTQVGDTTPPVRSGQGTNSVNADPTLSRPGAFDPGGAFGPEAVPATTTTGVVEGGGLIVPGTGTTGSSQQNVFVQPPAQSGVTVMNTPIFDQAARNGQAREARRRAAGDEPRVIGIAPRTERDLTWQMPDDPIIRH